MCCILGSIKNEESAIKRVYAYVCKDVASFYLVIEIYAAQRFPVKTHLAG